MSNQTNYEKNQKVNDVIKNKLIKRIEELQEIKASKELALKKVVEENLHLMDIISIFSETRTDTITVEGITYNVCDNEKRTKQINENNKTKEIYKNIIKQLDDCIKICQARLDETIDRENDIEELHIVNSMNQLFSVAREEKNKADELITNIDNKINKLKNKIIDKEEVKKQQQTQFNKTKAEYDELQKEQHAIEDEDIEKYKDIEKKLNKYWYKYLIIAIGANILGWIGIIPNAALISWGALIFEIIEGIKLLIESQSIGESIRIKQQKGSYLYSIVEELRCIRKNLCQQKMTIEAINEEIEELEQKIEEYKCLKLTLMDFENSTNIATILYPEFNQEPEIENNLGISRKREIPLKNNVD